MSKDSTNAHAHQAAAYAEKLESTYLDQFNFGYIDDNNYFEVHDPVISGSNITITVDAEYDASNIALFNAVSQLVNLSVDHSDPQGPYNSATGTGDLLETPGYVLLPGTEYTFTLTANLINGDIDLVARPAPEYLV